jgi:tetratricopeptide (TPR) repeat protein
VIKVSRNYANVLCRHHRFKEAFALLKATFVYDLDDTVTYKMQYELAACLLEQRKYSSALELVTQALAVPVMHPSLKAMFQLLAAKCHRYFKRYTDGLAVVNSLISSLESRRLLARALFARASIYNRLKRHSDALQDLDRALTLTRKSSPFYYGVLMGRDETLLQSGAVDEALNDITAVIDTIPLHQRARYNALVIRSACRIFKHEMDAGLRGLTASIDWLKSYAPHNQRHIAEMILKRGDLLRMLGRTGAKSDYDAVVAIASGLDDAGTLLAEVLVSRAGLLPLDSPACGRDLTRAQSILESIERTSAVSLGRVYQLQSTVAVSKHDYKSALKYINLAIRHDERDGNTENNVGYYVSRARINSRLGRNQDVVEDCTAVLAMDGSRHLDVMEEQKFATLILRANAYFDLAKMVTDKRGYLRRRRLLESAKNDVDQMQTLKAPLDGKNLASDLANEIRESLRTASRA